MTDDSETPPASAPPPTTDGRLSWRVPPDEATHRLDRALGRLLAPGYSRSYLAALIEEGTLRVDGVQVKPSFRLAGGELVEGELGESAVGLPTAQEMPLEILHEDEHLIAVSKPVGKIIHPGGGTRDGTLVNGLLHRYPELAVVGRAERPGIVHRLDRQTSGVLVVARTNDAARELVNQFKARTVKKEYVAFVWGELPFDSDWIDLPIGPHKKRPHLRTIDHEEGQSASSFYEVRERYGVASRLSVFPRTGRTHQIRVHLEHIGFPVVADPNYGRRAQEAFERWKRGRAEEGGLVPGLARQALHAHRLTLQHPGNGEPITLEAPLPEDMLELQRALEEAAG